MSQRTLDILNRWIAETVRPVPRKKFRKRQNVWRPSFPPSHRCRHELENLETEISEDSRPSW